MYIGDTSNHRIRKVTVSTGIITTIAGTGTGTYSGDGAAATSATLKNPYGVAVDSSGNHLYRHSNTRRLTSHLHHVGNVYISDNGNHHVRKITVSTSIITNIAGSGTGTYQSGGDGGQATSAGLNGPTGITLDSSGTTHLPIP